MSCTLIAAARRFAAARTRYAETWRWFEAMTLDEQENHRTAFALADTLTVTYLRAKDELIGLLDEAGLAAFRDGGTLYVFAGPEDDIDDIEDWDGEDRVLVIDLDRVGHAAVTPPEPAATA